jgi:hypothetical protein
MAIQAVHAHNQGILLNVGMLARIAVGVNIKLALSQGNRR